VRGELEVWALAHDAVLQDDNEDSADGAGELRDGGNDSAESEDGFCHGLKVAESGDAGYRLSDEDGNGSSASVEGPKSGAGGESGVCASNGKREGRSDGLRYGEGDSECRRRGSTTHVRQRRA